MKLEMEVGLRVTSWRWYFGERCLGFFPEGGWIPWGPGTPSLQQWAQGTLAVIPRVPAHHARLRVGPQKGDLSPEGWAVTCEIVTNAGSQAWPQPAESVFGRRVQKRGLPEF